MTLTPRLLAASLALAVLGLVGCGPIEYIQIVTLKANRALAAADAADARRCAPYEYTAAVEYLRKAREEAGYADYEAAHDFGRLSLANAEKAVAVSRERQRKDNCATALGPMVAPQGPSGGSSSSSTSSTQGPAR